MRDLLQEKDRTREAVSQIVSWCLVIALHQTEGIGKKRQDDVAAKALVIQEAAAKRLARQSRVKSSPGCAANWTDLICRMVP